MESTRSTGDPTNARVIEWREVSEGLVVFRVERDEGEAPAFEPGQYAVMGMPRSAEPVDERDRARWGADDPRWKHLIRREVSICSSAAERRWLEFFLVRVGDGKLTPRLWRAAEGGGTGWRVWLDERVKGDFTLERVERGSDVVMVATGTGVAPFLSMVRTYAGRGRWGRCVLLHGVRSAGELVHLDEMRAAEGLEGGRLRYVPVVSRGGVEWEGRRGRVQGVLEEGEFERAAGFALDAGRCEVFVCGNPGMIDEVSGMLVGRGFEVYDRRRGGNLHFERFWERAEGGVEGRKR